MSAQVSYRHVLLVVAATACWGGGTVLSKHVLDRGVAPMTLLVLELAASCMLLSGLMLVVDTGSNRGGRLGRLALLGVLNPGLAYALGLLGLVTVNASLSVLLWGTEPVLILVLAVLILRERVAAATVGAVAVALVGVLLVIYRPGVTGNAAGVALTVAAVTACACYTVLTRKMLLDDSSLLVALVQQGAALTFAVIVAFGAVALGVADVGFPHDVGTWLLAASSGAIYYGLAFWFYVGGLRGVSASVAGAFLPLIPVFGLIAAVLAGERLLGRQWLGAAIVIAATGVVAISHIVRPSLAAGNQPNPTDQSDVPL
jgi:drug/metabolite transporter (DMT)-like permease